MATAKKSPVVAAKVTTPAAPASDKKRVVTEAALGKMIDKVFGLRARKAEIESKLKDLEAEIATADAEIMEAMQQSGVEKTGTKLGTVSLGSTTVATVTDWDQVWAYIYKKKAGHLLQRRMSDPAWRELLELGTTVPGTEPFIKKRLNYRSA